VEISPQGVGIDKAARAVKLKGPKGKVVTLKAGNPDQFKVVKKGDQVEAAYPEALALGVEPAPKPVPAKK